MRHLLQPRVLTQACVAGSISALACYPRVSLWLNRPGPVWYLEATILLCSIMLWGFVFAWHQPYTGRPVLVRNLDPIPFIVATLTGVGAAVIWHLAMDPQLRPKLPQEYPADMEHWLAVVSFNLGLNQLFMVFAPFDWLMRLAKNQKAAMVLTALFGAAVWILKIHNLEISLSAWLLAATLIGGIAKALLLVVFYLRGGVILVWWWIFLFESRHLLYLLGFT